VSTSRGEAPGRLRPTLAAAVLALALGWVAAMPAGAVEPRFDADGTGPFPSDRLTVPDPTQRTGLRVALPLPNCRAEPSACDTGRACGGDGAGVGADPSERPPPAFSRGGEKPWFNHSLNRPATSRIELTEESADASSTAALRATWRRMSRRSSSDFPPL